MPTPPPAADVDEVSAELATVTLADEHRLLRRLPTIRERPESPAAGRFRRDLDRALARVERRRAAVPRIDYPAVLPVSAARDEIAEAIATHQVVVVAGETGSGKTTQLPKICLELGRGVRGMIGHTQPRRIAARSVAERIAEETGTEVGGAIGFSVRFSDRVGDTTLVKVMTDGILLRELSRDPMLWAYDTIIVDEAHERSLNIDFILGYLRQLLPRRPDLRVIVTSATIEPARFAEHFATADAEVPIISVSGRTYPVEIRYRPLRAQDRAPDDTDGTGDDLGNDRDDLDQIQGIRAAVDELWSHAAGDILVFLPTERDIRETAEALRPLTQTRGAEILPLFARLSAAEQHRIFTASTGRRIILSTNIAETSLTVPGIRYVIDTGTARISRYSLRTKVQRLPIEPVSQAAARQRSGRCGRVSDGICIRLYSENDFESRPEYTDPEILRTNLASVILQMASLGLGDIAAFPFVQTPGDRAIRDGIGLLTELGALVTDPAVPASRSEQRHGGPRLSAVGRQLAALPIEPRLGRMLVEADSQGCLEQLLIIVAALSLPDVRERPADHREAADAAHARFATSGSEFVAYLALWKHLEELRATLSHGQFRRRCQREFLHYLRIREWRELHRQLRQTVVELGWTPTSGAVEPDGDDNVYGDVTAIHQSVLSGLLSHIGVRDGDTREFLGARGTRFAVFPGSPLAKKPPRFVMAAELVETSRLWARTVARIEPEWAERLAGDLVKRQHSEPHWSRKRQATMAYERVTLYGVPLVTRRLVNFGRIDPEVSRELFIRHALVQGEWRSDHEFVHRNRELLDDAEELEHRARRRDIAIDSDQLFEFYDRRIGPDVVSARHFDTWWRTERRKNPALLDMTFADVADTSAEVSRQDFPERWQQGESGFALDYRFEPGADDDGVTVRVPVDLVSRVRGSGFDWQVPGLRTELAAALIRTLPKPLRRQVVPAPDFAAAALARLTVRSEPLIDGLARELSTLTDARISASDFAPDTVPDHLKMRFAAIDDSGSEIAAARSLTELRRRIPRSSSPRRPTTTAYTDWTAASIGDLPESVTEEIGGQRVTSYPGLAATPAGIIVRTFDTVGQRRGTTRVAVLALLERSTPRLRPATVSSLPTAQRISLRLSPYPDVDALLRDCTRCAIRSLMPRTAGDVRTADDFAAVRTEVSARAHGVAVTVLTTVADITQELGRAREALSTTVSADVRDDVTDQLDHLVYDGFVGATTPDHLRQVPRYLSAIVERLAQLPASSDRDATAMATIDRVVEYWNDRLARVPAPRRPAVNDAIGWMVEELRVGLFAQQLGTAYPVSEKRIRRAITDLT
ncbi:ATP-dependent RNA helicase HrpA [Williamsia sterculiae]|uniref:ATP-dependent helicase HrpA n=1 Tax=Williamsia sterculiae TaxID=1344003 RepID=A0A1N7EEF6_9NOCA|nr:ATP-dependent RNA helicase HrpA [Williamsia sterculiae]SIR86424.1 ATP-dependent helicase HrpA [Williamsia sterculiae]